MFCSPTIGMDDAQQRYFMNDMNRALPDAKTDMTTIRAALGETAMNIVPTNGDFKAERERDQKCKALQYPGTSMRPEKAATGCGWWYVDTPGVPSMGAYGWKGGPMDPNLPAGGEWIWDGTAAHKREGVKAMRDIHSCSDIHRSTFPNIGWCASLLGSSHAFITDGHSRPLYPQEPNGDCDGFGSAIITPGRLCPPPPPPSDSQGQG